MTAAEFRTCVKANGGCLEWTKGRAAGEYGSAYIPGITECRAHRVAWVLEHGPIPVGLHVCHRCDNPACVNAADHLFLSTPFGNKIDSIRKGRNAGSDTGSRSEGCLVRQNEIAARRSRNLTAVFLHLVAQEAA